MNHLSDKRIAAYIASAIVVLLLLAFGSAAGCKEYNRYQKRADANNAVKVTHIEIKRAEQQAQINRAQVEATKAEADKRREEAKGIRDAQDTINATLTPLYVQHEAIQAQKAIASSGKNNTVIYVPSGTNGTPIITAGADAGK
jgi:regulator of protease activity HflC (stomatin/prohibitin superfamily)